MRKGVKLSYWVNKSQESINIYIVVLYATKI